MDAHKKKCTYKGHSGRLCRHLGFNCDLSICKLNKKDPVDHFVQVHGAKFTTNNITGQELKICEDLPSCSWPPIIVTAQDNCYSLATGIKNAGFLSFECVTLDNPNGRDYEATFSVGIYDSKVNPPRWVVPLSSWTETVRSKVFLEIRMERLKDLRNSNGDLPIALSVHNVDRSNFE